MNLVTILASFLGLSSDMLWPQSSRIIMSISGTIFLMTSVEDTSSAYSEKYHLVEQNAMSGSLGKQVIMTFFSMYDHGFIFTNILNLLSVGGEQ